jgi:hypothetical protein
MNSLSLLRPLGAVLFLGWLAACGRAVVGFPFTFQPVDDTGQDTGQANQGAAPDATAAKATGQPPAPMTAPPR